jgi:hypothetical protein
MLFCIWLFYDVLSNIGIINNWKTSFVKHELGGMYKNAVQLFIDYVWQQIIRKMGDGIAAIYRLEESL